MKSFVILLISIFICEEVFCQSICQTGDEGTTVTLTAPAGKVFISVTFASYGTPNGSCGSFTIGGCHAANSKTIVESILLGQNSASIGANNGVFGDPCGGTFKRLYIEAVYGNPMPLKLISFSGIVARNENLLKWETANEVNTKEIVIERSFDGSHFFPIGNVKTNNQDRNVYSFPDKLFSAGLNYYRLKMEDIDGRYEYSGVISIKREEVRTLQVFPNPVKNILTVKGMNAGDRLEIMNCEGRLLKGFDVDRDVMVVDLSAFARGVYFIRCVSKKDIVVQRIVKQ
jgi:hypothetical protein